MLPTMVKAALPAVPGVNLLPGIRRTGSELPELSLVRHDVPVDVDHAAAYAALCGFPRKDTLPLPYPHLLAFGLHLEIMTDALVPVPGDRHRAPRELHHPAPPDRGDREAPGDRPPRQPAPARQGPGLRPADHRALRRRAGLGGDLDLPASRSTGDRGRRPARPPTSAAPPTGTVWKLPGDLGRRYAGVSGDHNPIHLYGLTAKAFGFPRQIAHGMWSLARCVGALENRLPDHVRVDVAFKKPILLPGSVAFGSRPTDDGYAFSLTNPKTGAPHLAGRTVRA